jgi:hypothetical protein
MFVVDIAVVDIAVVGMLFVHDGFGGGFEG